MAVEDVRTAAEEEPLRQKGLLCSLSPPLSLGIDRSRGGSGALLSCTYAASVAFNRRYTCVGLKLFSKNVIFRYKHCLEKVRSVETREVVVTKSDMKNDKNCKRSSWREKATTSTTKSEPAAAETTTTTKTATVKSIKKYREAAVREPVKVTRYVYHVKNDCCSHKNGTSNSAVQ